jgi:AAA domain
MCRAAQPDLVTFTCPSGCDLQAAYERAGWSSVTPGPPSANALPRVRSLGEILSDPKIMRPPTFIVPGLVESGAVTLLSGPPKAGKSTYASQVAADFSRGRAAIDGTPMRAGRVLWFAIDEPLRRLAHRLPALDADPDHFLVVGRENDRLTPDRFAALIEQEAPALVVVDTLSQLAADNGIKVNDAESVAPFIKDLVCAVQAREHCGALLLFHSPHHAARASGSVAWAAVVDATLVLRRPAARVLRPGQSPDDDADEGTAEDGRRILEGITRWSGEQRTMLSFRDGRYRLGTGEAPLIERVRWFLTNTEPGPGITSAAAIAAKLKVRDASVGEVIHDMIQRGEVRSVGEGRKRYIERAASLSLYAGSDPEAVGSAGERIREEKESGGNPSNTGVCAWEEQGRTANGTRR